MYINEEWYLCQNVWEHDMWDYTQTTNYATATWVQKTIKYKVNKEGLFEEVKEDEVLKGDPMDI